MVKELIIENILELLKNRTKQQKYDIKQSYESVKKEIEAKFDGIPLPKEHIQQLILYGVGERYDVPKNEINQMITASEIAQELENEEKQEEVDNMNDIPESSGSKWKEFLSDLERPERSKKQYKKFPSLVKQYGIRYTMKLTNPSKLPFKLYHKKEDYNSFKFEVELIGIEPEYKYDEVYDKGDNKGDKMYVDGQEYALWLHDKEFWAFVDFWERVTSDGERDGREFTYEKISRGKYTDYIFKEA